MKSLRGPMQGNVNSSISFHAKYHARNLSTVLYVNSACTVGTVEVLTGKGGRERVKVEEKEGMGEGKGTVAGDF